jgi:hypothetical protein
MKLMTCDVKRENYGRYNFFYPPGERVISRDFVDW